MPSSTVVTSIYIQYILEEAVGVTGIYIHVLYIMYMKTDYMITSIIYNAGLPLHLVKKVRGHLSAEYSSRVLEVSCFFAWGFKVHTHIQPPTHTNTLAVAFIFCTVFQLHNPWYRVDALLVMHMSSDVVIVSCYSIKLQLICFDLSQTVSV